MRKIYNKLFVTSIVFAILLSTTATVYGQATVRAKKASTEKAKEAASKEKFTPLLPTKKAGQKSFNTINFKKKTSKPQHVIAAGDGTLLYGGVIYADTWSSDYAPYGIYSFPASASTNFTSVHLDDLLVPYSGVLLNGKYYANTAISDFFGATYYHVVYNATDWSQEVSQEITLPAGALTYDVVSGNVYALTYNTTAQTFSELSIYDINNATYTKIADIPALYTLSANSAGELYGVGTNGNLYKINKTSGTSTNIGATGVTPKYIQSAAFDPATGKLYWAASLSDDSANLYEINLSTGVATLISAMPNNEEVAGLYIPAPEAEDGAPAKASNLALTFTAPGALTGKISFDVPLNSFGGTALTGNVTAKIVVNGGAPIEVTGLVPGATYESAVLTFAQGTTTINVVLSNAAGDSPKTSLVKWAGADVPVGVTGLTLEKSATGKAKLTWTAPTAGLHDGYFDTSTLTYKVVRLTDNVTVATGLTATTFTDESLSDALAFYSYSVTPSNVAGDGPSVISNALTLGSSFTVPFYEPFDTADPLNLWSIIDNNGDAKTWKYDTATSSVYYGYSSANDADDWLITPPIKLSAGVTYKLSYKTKARSATYPEALKVTIGTGATVGDQTTVLADHPSITNVALETFSQNVTVSADGDYYFGFYAYSIADNWNLYVDDIRVEQLAAAGAPGPVTDLTLTPGANGALTADISFKAPATTFEGNPLADITAIDVYRNSEATPVKSFANPAIGANLSFTDNSPINGFNTYKVIPSNGNGSGLETSKTAFVGVDIPDTIVSVVLANVAGDPVITWTAPTIGANGGYINPADLKYKVESHDGTVLVSDLTATTYTDATLDKTVQTYAVYYVTPYNTQGEGAYTASNGLVFGPPYVAPFVESFPGATLQNFPWIVDVISGTSTGWSLATSGEYPTAAAQDGDGGLATFNSFSLSAGAESRLISPSIDISSLANPRLSFWLFHYQGTYSGDDKVRVEISKNDGAFEAVENGLIELAANNNGWTEYKLPLTAFAGATKINLAFTGISDYGYNIHIDNIAIKDSYTHELIAKSLTGPASLKIGATGTYTVTVKNDGAVSETYKVELYKDGTLYETKDGTALEAGSTATVDFATSATLDDAGKTYVYSAKVVLDTDENPSNNTTTTVSTTISVPTVPAVNDLSGTLNVNTVTLTWSEPVTSSPVKQAEVTEDFESYTPFIIDNVGDWTLTDVDGSTTYVINGYSTYDNAGSPMAFQVFNPVAVGIPDGTAWVGNSGGQFLVNFNADTPPNNDWLISPELSGSAQTISFFAKSITDQYGLERINILYSTTDKNPASFTALNTSGYLEVPIDWTEYTYSLPAGAKYFAIQSVSDDAFALLIDDITYNNTESSSLTLLGYNVYRNGAKLTATPVGETTYIDPALAVGDYAYKVTAVYDKGESVYSNEVSFTVVNTGLSSIFVDYKVFAVDKSIVIEGAGGKNISIVTVDGKQIYNSVGSDYAKIRVASAGVYLVKIDGKAGKLIVK